VLRPLVPQVRPRRTRPPGRSSGRLPGPRPQTRFRQLRRPRPLRPSLPGRPLCSHSRGTGDSCSASVGARTARAIRQRSTASASACFKNAARRVRTRCSKCTTLTRYGVHRVYRLGIRRARVGVDVSRQRKRRAAGLTSLARGRLELAREQYEAELKRRRQKAQTVPAQLSRLKAARRKRARRRGRNLERAS